MYTVMILILYVPEILHFINIFSAPLTRTKYSPGHVSGLHFLSPSEVHVLGYIPARAITTLH